jgi:hypothetical protein
VDIVTDLVLHASDLSFRKAKEEDPAYEDRVLRNTGAGWDQFETQAMHFFNLLFGMSLLKAPTRNQVGYDVVERDSIIYGKPIVVQAKNRKTNTDAKQVLESLLGITKARRSGT